MSPRGRRKTLSHSKRVEKFLNCVEELKVRPFILKGLREFEFHIDFQREPGKIFCEFKEADQEHFRSFLLTFRKFLLNDEPANIDNILNTCRKFVKSEQTELREVLEKFKTIWGYQYRKGTIRITSGSLPLTPEYVLDCWINGLYFHNRDPQKSEQLCSLLNQELPSVKLQLMWSLPILTETIIRIGRLLTKAINECAFDFREEK